jgi:2-desacetyl-2-hydroxyethyl bacteriochlorophyllide A dehydrogenase
MRSLSVVFPGPGVVEVVEREIDPPGPGQITCEALSSLVSTGTETFCLAGRFDAGTFWEEWVQYPFAPGYSMTARVIAVGDGVTDLVMGDRVALPTSHAQRVTVDRALATPVPAGVSDEDACWASLAVTTQLGVRRSRLELGESVGVVGLGLLGQLVVRYLRLAGARHIIAIDPDPGRLNLAAEGGANVTIGAPADAAEEAIRAATGGHLLDVVFDITGHPAAFAAASTLVRPLGRLVLLGDSPQPSQQRLGPRIVADAISIIGVHANTAATHQTPLDRWTVAEMTALFFDYVRDGRMSVDSLISHRVSPRDAPQLYAALTADRSQYMGVLFDWSQVTP